MPRTYVAIYQNKSSNYSLYYDFKKCEIFTIGKQQNQTKITSISFVGGFVGIIFYAIMKNVSFNLGLSPFQMLTISGFIGIILGFISITLISKATDKKLEYIKIVMHPTNQELREYISKGEKQSLGLIFMMLILFFLVLVSGMFVYFDTQGLFMFFINILAWGIFILFICAVRPVRRYQAHKLLKQSTEKLLD